MNIRGSGNRSDYCGAVVGSTGRITIASLGLAFRVLAFSNSDRS